MIVKIYNRIYEFKDGTPNEVLYFFKERINKVPKDVYYKYLDWWPSCKKFVIGDCDITGQYTENRMDRMMSRKYHKNKLIHPSVIMKTVCNSEEWKNVNSEAQLIAQNRPGQREINSISVKKVWESDKADKWRNGIIKHNQSEGKRLKIKKASSRLWQTKEYRKMMLDKFEGFQGVSGVFYSKYSGKLRFDSTYELFYAFVQDLNGKKLKRFKGEIKYVMDDKERGYRPDYIVDNSIIEIKSKWIMEKYQTLKEITLKKEAAIEFVKNNNFDNFFIFMEDELSLIGPFNLKDRIISMLEDNRHILIKHGKIKKYKRRDEKYLQVEELITKWNLLK